LTRSSAVIVFRVREQLVNAHVLSQVRRPKTPDAFMDAAGVRLTVGHVLIDVRPARHEWPSPAEARPRLLPQLGNPKLRCYY
jgi:hypothetical protein